MKSILFTERNRSDDLLHVETQLGIVNIRVGLHDREGRRVESVEIIPNAYAGEAQVVVDGYRNTRLVESDPEWTQPSLVERLKAAADEAFDPETAIDSDGYDQGVRAGLIQAAMMAEGSA